MTPQQKRVIRDTWQRVSALGDAAAALFYDRLFEINPALRPLFATADMASQRTKLLQALGLVVAGLDRLESLVPTLQTLGRRHAGYGVQKEHYRQVGAALLWTLEHGLGADWNEEAEEAWAQAYALVSGVMLTADQAVETGSAG